MVAHIKYRQIQKIVKWIVVLTPFIILFWLGWQYLAINGHLTIDYNFKGESPFISQWRPLGRADDRAQNLRTGDTYQKIVGEPVYLDVNVPRAFDDVTVTVEYDNSDQSLLEFGVVTSEDPWNVQLFPFENQTIDTALATWPRLDDTGVTLLQREQRFASVADFLQNYPRDGRIGVYNYFLPTDYFDDIYQPQPNGVESNRALRGPHEFAVYIKDEPLKVNFTLRDINREFNEDLIKVEVWSDGAGELIDSQILPDDGVAEATGVASASITLPVSMENLSEGAYIIKLIVNNDIVVQNLRSEQDKFVVKDHIYVVNNIEYQKELPELSVTPTTLYVDGEAITAKTDHPNGLQQIKVNGGSLDVNAISATFWWEDGTAMPTNLSTGVGSTNLRVVELPVNDLYLRSNNGFWAFTPESYFDPNYQVRPINESASVDELDFMVFSNYQSPAVETKFKQQTVNIDLDTVLTDRKKLTFVLSAPGLDRDHYSLSISKIGFDFTRQPLWQRLSQRWLNK